MGSLRLQFHVLPAELLDWVEEWQAQYFLHVGVVYYFPDYRFDVLQDISDLKNDIQGNRPPDEVWLHISPFNLKRGSKTKMEAANAGCFFISFPDSSQSGLREALIGAEAKDADAWSVWKKLGTVIKSRCKKGMWVLNPKMGIKGFRKTARYTAGVAEAAKNGLALLPFAGGNIMSIDEPVGCDNAGK